MFADSNSDYRAGSDFAHQIKGQGSNSIQGFKPQESIPGYNANPDETKYYGGVTAGGDGGLKNDGTTEWATGETGQTITESFMNKPKDILSPDAPFIQTGRDVVSRADSIVGNTGQQCSAQQINRSEFTNYTCERDTTVEEFCTRKAIIKDNVVRKTVRKTYQSAVMLDYSTTSRKWGGTLSIPEKGRLIHVAVDGERLIIPWNSNCNRDLPSAKCKNSVKEMLSIMGKDFPVDVVAYPRRDSICTGGQNSHCTYRVRDGWGKIHQAFDMDMQVEAGQSFPLVKSSKTFDGYKNMASVQVTITLTLDVEVTEHNPSVEWVESCPFNKADGVLAGTECTEPGGTKTGVMEGKPWSITLACWAYRDKYVTQSADNGTCQKYVDNPACTLASRQCAFYSDEGTCLHEYATYSCESKVSGKVMICGGDVFCLDGECDKAQSGQSNDFAEAVSQLAALAAAGKDVAALDGVDVRAFTGQAKFCRKAAAGFSNCCKDGGWGQDVGLAKCNSEEKALGKAKDNKLTVSVGEFCSKKVLGVCLQKKRSYCQFDSKLAQIVQQQGRNGQLRISFGSAKHPDCRGITVDELQTIQFDRLDFTNFYEDLMNNQKIPDSGVLTQKVKEQIADQLKQAGQ